MYGQDKTTIDVKLYRSLHELPKTVLSTQEIKHTRSRLIFSKQNKEQKKIYPYKNITSDYGIHTSGSSLGL